ncbi:protein of unknown function [Acidithiobacillus ferrivorans]|uniref:Uncharacterized protein n=1 Tax=Acidithiobacillus ferrivorans TaxID=160808 RepID=A0A060UUF4_9PROT|nr:hypothetical protein AFERRI_40161 [Acidithiobacillus ferrivorans]SMH64169.1 protein of unknown function [Acidithiobacillus ferrivorans]
MVVPFFVVRFACPTGYATLCVFALESLRGSGQSKPAPAIKPLSRALNAQPGKKPPGPPLRFIK